MEPSKTEQLAALVKALHGMRLSMNVDNRLWITTLLKSVESAVSDEQPDFILAVAQDCVQFGGKLIEQAVRRSHAH